MPCQTMRVIQRQKQIADEEQKKKKKVEPRKRWFRKDTKKIVKQRAEKFGWKVMEKNGWTLILTKPFTQDRIEIEIKKRGIVSLNVPGMISGPNHSNAESFLRDVTSALSAKVISVVHKTKHAMMHALGIHHHH